MLDLFRKQGDQQQYILRCLCIKEQVSAAPASVYVHSLFAGGLYTDEHGVFGDNQFRFALLSLAACEAPLVLNIGGHRCCRRNLSHSLTPSHTFTKHIGVSGTYDTPI